jgi:hypothetical protein
MNFLNQNVVGQFESSLKSGVDSFLEDIGKSPAIIGLAVLIINLGGRYLASDITQYDEKVLNNKIMKKLTIFAIAFLSTRDIKYSILIVFIYTILFNPLGLAYKIIARTQMAMNPLNYFKMTIENDNDSMLVEKRPKEIYINKIKL